MKRLVLIPLLCLLGCVCKAEYIPNTMWPYVYEDFCQGELILKGGDKVRAAFNIHLLESELHYLMEDKILFVATPRIEEVIIGEERYIPVDGKMMRIVVQNGENYLLSCMMGDFNALITGTGAYGASANTQAVLNLSSIEIGGKNIVNHAILLQNKEGGKELPIIEKYYFRIEGKCISANKKEVEKALITDSPTWNTFLKENKIRWRKKASLIKVLYYFSSL